MAFGVNSSGHLAAHLLIALATTLIPCLIFYLVMESGQMQDWQRRALADPDLKEKFVQAVSLLIVLTSVTYVSRVVRISARYNLQNNPLPPIFAVVGPLLLAAAVMTSLPLPVWQEISNNHAAMVVGAVLVPGLVAIAATRNRISLGRFSVRAVRDLGTWATARLRGQRADGGPPANRLTQEEALTGLAAILLWLVPLVFLLIPVLLYLHTGDASARFGSPALLAVFVSCAAFYLFFLLDLAPGSLLLALLLIAASFFALAWSGSIDLSGSKLRFGVRDLRAIAPPEPVPPLALGAEPPADGPIILIAADGGGIRSAYWTNAVLGEIGRHFPELQDHVYAVGGASGGSVGLGIYAALLHDGIRGNAVRDAALGVLSEDYISTAASFMLWRDLPDSLAGCPNWLTDSCDIDRMIAMERQLEEAYARLAHGSDTLAGPIIARPMVFFNATDSGAGSPLVISATDLRLTRGRAAFAGEMSMSTAMFLSARFPIISPAAAARLRKEGGLWRFGGTEGRMLALADGGYSDNTGTLALAALIEGPLAAYRDRIFVISITNDPYRWTLSEGSEADPCAPQISDPSSLDSFLAMFSGPVATLDRVRWQQSEEHRARLAALVAGRFEMAEMRGCRSDPEVPLGWTLSPESRDYMDRKAAELVHRGTPLWDLLERAFP